MKYSNNYLALAYRIDRLPRRMKRETVWKRMLDFIRNGTDLPDSWSVTLRWQNSPKQPWREAEFQEAISDSRPGFVKLVEGRILRDMSQTITEAERIQKIEKKYGRKKRGKVTKRRKASRRNSTTSTSRSNKRKTNSKRSTRRAKHNK